ncbi:MAG: carbohydrate kinase family protein [Candidatus Thorarchaeota archaeon]
MYELVVIGNPYYNIIRTPQFETQNRILSDPSSNIARVASKLGVHELVLIGAIGQDYRNALAQDLEDYGVPEYYAIESPTTGGFHIDCHHEGLPVLSLLESARELRIRDIPEEFLSAENIVIAPSLMETNAEIIEWISNTSDASIILDTQGLGRRVNQNREIEFHLNGGLVENLLDLATIVKIERPLWKLVTGETDPLLAAEFLVENGADIGIAMLSSMGAVVYDGNEFLIVPTEKRFVRNIMAASDAFLAAFVVYLSRSDDMTERAAFASGAASTVMEHSCVEFDIIPEEVHQRQQAIIDRVVVK